MRLGLHKEHVIDCVELLIAFAAIFFVLYLIFTGHVRNAIDAAVAMSVYVAINFVAFSILIIVNFEKCGDRAVKGYIILLTCICLYLACNLAIFKWFSLFLLETLVPVYATILFLACWVIVISFIALLAGF